MISRPPARAVANTAGEFEPEAFSRRCNLIEPIVVMVVLLAGAWWLAYPLGVLQGVEAASRIARGILVAALIYTIVLGPWLHRDTAASRGLGTPRRVLEQLRALPRNRRLVFGGLLLGFIGLLTALAYETAPGALQFLAGVPKVSVVHFRATPIGSAVVLCGAFGVAVFFAACAIRYDNLLTALRSAGGILLVLLAVVLLAALIINGPAAFATFDPARLLERAAGYVFWGAFQQLIFCSYFGTRLRKGIGPGADGGAQRRRRLGAAVLTGLFFGLIHISSWSLVLLTWLLGTCLAWVSMHDRNRNLLVFGVVHGVLGTCAGWLFRAGSDLHINMRVGPWAMPRVADWPTLIATTLLIGGFCFLILRAARLPRTD